MEKGAAKYCVKMRAECLGRHVSGAEKIVRGDSVPKTAARLAERALSHPKGSPDFVNIKIEAARDIIALQSLPVSTNVTRTTAEGRRRAAELLADAGISRIDEIMSMFPLCHGMRGAMLLDADTLERLEPDHSRGVRATCMDDAESAAKFSASGKNHYAEAIVLATKVANAPGIVGEICVSDDPDYVTGYVATRAIGYQRITTVKDSGDPNGGRIFLYRGPREGVAETIRFLERQCVVVEGVPSLPGTAAERRFDGLADELRRIDEAGLRRTVRAIPESGPHGPVAILSSNDYLGFADGFGSTGSRLTTGTHPEHLALERHIAAFKGTESALVFATGYMANVGTVTAIAGKGDAIVSDELNHASIIDGCRLSGADVLVYRHGDLADMERKLAACREHRRRLAVSDAVFSMDGDILDLPRFIDICRRHDAFSMIDEAHATGVVGQTGRGLVEHFGCAHPDIATGTLSKALGAEGGFTCGSRLLVDYLVNKSRPFIFSTAMSPRQAAAADAALSRLESEPWQVGKLRDNVRFFIAELARHGIAAKTDSAIVPIPIGDERKACFAAERLMERGFVVNAIRYPTVARGSARLRVAISAAHAKETLAAAASAVANSLP